jgi:hypothetical protein
MGKGYTKHGYPIVWLRFAKKSLSKTVEEWARLSKEEQSALAHEQCMAKLESGDGNFADNSTAVKTKRKNQTIEFELRADDRCYHLTINGKTLYPRDMKSAARIIQKEVVRNRIRNKGVLSSLNELIEVTKGASVEVEKMFLDER